ncbi:unnamed protein product [Oncorhynchus mykiss]|uniref:Phorbol-ester/DAG-type domain-containing protein n=1 Tax=Oncorhynchus mykiss TaxID=8022 RepID=A0A060XFD4_ONCMY|nr:unnamed protein product [Oncorhynchus mykiss]
MVESDEQSERDSGGGAAMAALHQCELIQNMIEISISSLQGLRTKCAASNDLTQQEIRTLEVKLMKYICKQLQCKQKVPETERPQALDSYPRLGDWLRTINLRPELIEVSPRSVCVWKVYNMGLRRGSPQAVRRDIGLAVTHRFSTKSWLSQTCQVCQKNMMFGVKCKHCRLKCHNKCTKESPSCRISFLPITKIRRTESVPSDINNPVDRPLEAPQFGTLPKAITKKDHPPVLNQLDSSSNPSSTTSSTPSSPAPFQNPPSATPPPNPSPKVHRENRFHFPAACYFQHRQQFIFPGEFTVQSQTLLGGAHSCPHPQPQPTLSALSISCIF